MTTTAPKSLKAFCEASHLNPDLIRAVVRQIGGWQSFCESAGDITRHGIDGGFHGFIHYSETEEFAKRNMHLISKLAEAQAEELGDDVFSMIRGFGCFRDEKLTGGEIAEALYRGRNVPNGVNILNALAWYAGEEVCRSYCDPCEQD